MSQPVVNVAIMAMLDDIYQYDLRLLLWCRKSRYYPPFIALIRTISKSGDGYMQLLVPLCCLFIAPELGQPFFVLALLAFSVERPIYFILKNWLKRRRPPEVVPDFTSIVIASDKFSFPSGHTMAAFCLAGLSVMFFGAAAAPLYLWALLVAISRVILGVHFPTDTVAGAVLGTLIAYIMVNI
ncbi:phosphatase PAP2 family protein [Thalassotalea fusca]